MCFKWPFYRGVGKQIARYAAIKPLKWSVFPVKHLAMTWPARVELTNSSLLYILYFRGVSYIRYINLTTGRNLYSVVIVIYITRMYTWIKRTIIYISLTIDICQKIFIFISMNSIKSLVTPIFFALSNGRAGGNFRGKSGAAGRVFPGWAGSVKPGMPYPIRKVTKVVTHRLYLSWSSILT